MALKELIFNIFYFWGEGVVVLKELILTVSTLGWCVLFLLSWLANLAEWINLINFRKLNHSSSINITSQKINN